MNEEEEKKKFLIIKKMTLNDYDFQMEKFIPNLIKSLKLITSFALFVRKKKISLKRHRRANQLSLNCLF